MAVTTSAITVKTPDGDMDGVVSRPQGAGSWPAIIVYMDAMGVRSELIEMTERLASHGYLVVLPNMFYRAGPQPPVDKTAFAKEGSPERERIFALIRSLDHAKVMRDTKAILDWLGERADAKPSPMGVVGYCQGGGYALTAAATFPDRIGAAAVFHGGWLATDRPDSPHRLASKMRARLYIGVAGIDPMFPDEERHRLEQALADGGCQFNLEVYEGVRHGFSVTAHPAYDRTASERHWNELTSLFGSTLV